MLPSVPWSWAKDLIYGPVSQAMAGLVSSSSQHLKTSLYQWGREEELSILLTALSPAPPTGSRI